MNAPICEFIKDYAARNVLRLHMPGHKGRGPVGCESIDITEIPGADSLYEASGIIRESETNASALFGCPTFYSTEGSSLCIRAMVYLACIHARKNGCRPIIAAGRNAHKTFLSAAALMDVDVIWLSPTDAGSYLSCALSAAEVEAALESAPEPPAAVYLTSPDYLGNTVDIRAMAEVCRSHGTLLMVDNAHGAYLHFLPDMRGPIDLGADMCCDSAHKTLPVLTGGAYLHISKSAPQMLAENAKQALAMFGSTSPSYLILQSLDAANCYLANGYGEELAAFAEKTAKTRERLLNSGYVLCGDEPAKITVSTKSYGYRGQEMGDILLKKGIACEFADPDYLVFMLTPETGAEGLTRLENALVSTPARAPVTERPPVLTGAHRAMSIREAAFSPRETVPARKSIGRVLAAATVGCPPAVPIVVCGEIIDANAVKAFEYYGIDTCVAVK